MLNIAVPITTRAEMNTSTPRFGSWTYHHVLPVRMYYLAASTILRVIIEPSKIDDHEAMQLARNIAKQIEENLEYPGQIKVTVVRETRCVEYAK